MHTRLGWFATVVGAVLVLGGVAVMVVLGPDSRFTTGPHKIDTDAAAVVTAPKVITWRGVRVDVLAEVPVGKPVFVGLGNSVDVEDYVRDVRRLEVTRFRTPWDATTREVGERPVLPGAPTALDWWIADGAGLGGARMSATLPDETVSVAILSVGATNLSGLEVTMAYGVQGGFARGLAAALVGLAALWGGRELRLGRHLVVDHYLDEDLVDDPSDDDVEYLYVYVDEDGVEHEITADEAERLERSGEVDTVVEHAPDPADAPDAPGPAGESEEPAAPEVPGVVTAGEIVAREDAGLPPPPVIEPEPEPEPGPEPDPEPEPEPDAEPETSDEPKDAPDPDPEPVVYVFVDEDGVEHEVTEAELDQYEIVDEDEEGGR